MSGYTSEEADIACLARYHMLSRYTSPSVALQSAGESPEILPAIYISDNDGDSNRDFAAV